MFIVFLKSNAKHLILPCFFASSTVFALPEGGTGPLGGLILNEFNWRYGNPGAIGAGSAIIIDSVNIQDVGIGNYPCDDAYNMADGANRLGAFKSCEITRTIAGISVNQKYTQTKALTKTALIAYYSQTGQFSTSSYFGYAGFVLSVTGIYGTETYYLPRSFGSSGGGVPSTNGGTGSNGGGGTQQPANCSVTGKDIVHTTNNASVIGDIADGSLTINCNRSTLVSISSPNYTARGVLLQGEDGAKGDLRAIIYIQGSGLENKPQTTINTNQTLSVKSMLMSDDTSVLAGSYKGTVIISINYA